MALHNYFQYAEQRNSQLPPPECFNYKGAILCLASALVPVEVTGEKTQLRCMVAKGESYLCDTRAQAAVKIQEHRREY